MERQHDAKMRKMVQFVRCEHQNSPRIQRQEGSEEGAGVRCCVALSTWFLGWDFLSQQNRRGFSEALHIRTHLLHG